MIRYLKSSVVFIYACLFIFNSPAFSRDKRLFEPEDLLRLKNITEPQISPKGDWVAFTVSQFEENLRTNSEIWIVSRDGNRLKRLTENPGPDSTPRWSPDGKILAFLSRRDEDKHTQVYFFSLENESLQRKTGVEGNVKDLKWSPDGRMIAYLKEDVLTEEEKARRDKGNDAQVIDRDYTHSRLWVLEIFSEKVRPVTGQNQTVFLFNWSPDSKSIAVQASPIPTAEGNEYQSHLGLVDVETGKEKILTQKINALAAPGFSSDGKWIVYIGPIGNFKERGIAKVILIQGGEPLEFLRDYPGNVWDITWHPHQEKLLAAVARGPHNYLVSLDLKGKTQDLIEINHSIIPYWGSHWSVSADGEWIAFLNEKPDWPKEVWLTKINGEGRKQLTFFNDYLKEIKLGEVEAIEYRNPQDGSGAFGIIVQPSGFESGKRYPLVVLLHGGPAYNWGIGVQISNWAQLFASQGYMVFLPNFRGSSGLGMKWMMANVGDWGKGPMSDVMNGVDYLTERGLVDDKKIFVGGGSYGGYLTSWIITQTDRFKAAYISAGVTDLVTQFALTDEPSFLIGYFNKAPYDNLEIYVKNSPITYASQVKTPVLIVHGDKDLRVPLSQAYEFYSALKHYGARVEMVVYPREAHGVREYAHQLDVMARVLSWFKKHS